MRVIFGVGFGGFFFGLTNPPSMIDSPTGRRPDGISRSASCGGSRLWVAGFPYRINRNRLKVIGDMERNPRRVLVKARHAVRDQTQKRGLQGHVAGSRARVVFKNRVRVSVVTKRFLGNDQNEKPARFRPKPG